MGYRGVSLPDVPFHERWGTIENEKGRVQTGDGETVTGLYTAGWIKRGPSGVIGTNKTCAQETVQCMVKDLEAGKLLEPDSTDRDALEALVRERQPQVITYEDWKAIDAAEISKGESDGRPRVKFTNLEDMLALLGR